jgi:gamma-glutamyltranspeptidase / glutathione hydrolase
MKKSTEGRKSSDRTRRAILLTSVLVGLIQSPRLLFCQTTVKPVLHGSHWVAITGKPLAATAGSMMFQKGGNAVDAACAMVAATCTMWDDLSWGGETQALIFDPRTQKVTGINALGVAPTGATADFFLKKGLRYPPETGPLAAVTPGTPGGILVMLSEYGRLSLAEVLEPAIQMADGYPIEAAAAAAIEREKERLNGWPFSRRVMLPHPGRMHEGPEAGEIFRQPALASTLRKLVEAERKALAEGKNRKEAILAAYDRFYRGDIAAEFCAGVRESGGLITGEDLANWRVRIEEPVRTSYKGIDVCKLTTWVQGPVMLQTLNILENFDLKAMGYNSGRYIHTLYQAMNLAYADRDFYYGDPAVPPEEPVRGLLSKEYAAERAKLINAERNDPGVRPGDPYPFQNGVNPFRKLLEIRNNPATGALDTKMEIRSAADWNEPFYRGTTSVEAADAEGWAVSVTPSGGWIPAVIEGNTGIGLSQRMQSFVLRESEDPFNVVRPGQRPRSTLTPSLALKDGKPFLAFAVQGGDTQDQNLLQFFLNVVEFGMNVQEACEAANFNSYQMHSSFGLHESFPGRILLNEAVPLWVRKDLAGRGYELRFEAKTSGPITAIDFDRGHGTLWGGASNYGEDYGIAW